MTPPLIRPWGQIHGGDLSLTEEEVRNFRPTPEFQQLSRSLLSSRELASDLGRRMLAQSLPNCRNVPDCDPDLSLLPQAVSQSLALAPQNPTLYRMSINFLAAEYMNVSDVEARDRMRAQARQIGLDALDRVSDPAFQPQPEDSHGRELPLRTRARILFNIVGTLSALLARPEAEIYSAEDRALMRDYFVRIRGLVEQLQERKRLDPQVLGWPDYFTHYIQSQIAMIDGQTDTAFTELLETRRLLQALPPEARNLTFPSQVGAGTELALQSIPRTGTAVHTDSLRSLISIEALGYVEQNDYLRTHGSEDQTTAARRAQALSLLAATHLQAGHATANVTELLEYLRSGSNSASLRQSLDDRLRSDEALRSSLREIFPGNLNNEATRRSTVESIVELAQASAETILDHAEEEPYRTLIFHDRQTRPLARATELLNEHSDLLNSFRSVLGLESGIPAGTVVRELAAYGELLPTLLSNLVPELVDSEDYQIFFRALNQAALGMDGEGLRLNIEQPLLDMLEALNRLAQTDDEHAAAYFAIFRSMEGLEQLSPTISLSPSFRRIAGNHANRLENFSASRVVRHLTSPSSLGMIAAGTVLSELAPIWLLSGARIPFLRGAEAAAAVRTSGELGILMRAGRLTGWGEATVGLGIGLAMHLGSVGSHVVATRGLNVSEYGDELQNLGLWNLAVGTVLSMAALGMTMGASHWMRRGLLPEAAAMSPGRIALGHTGLRLGTWAVGTGSMLAAHSGTAAFAGHAAMPTGEQAAEVFLTMALWDASAAGLRFGVSRSRYWRHQAGPFRTEQLVRTRLRTILRRNPELRGQRNFLLNYLRLQTRNAREFGRIGRSLEEGLIPHIEGRAEGRRLAFQEAAPAEGVDSSAESPASSSDAAPALPAPSREPMSRTEAARTIMNLTEAQQAMVRQILRSTVFRSAQHPQGIHAMRRALRDRLAAGEESPVLWVQADLNGAHLFLEILPGEPAAGERADTFRLDRSGKVSHLNSEDPVLRSLLASYNNEASLSAPIFPPSPGSGSATRTDTEAATAAHRLPSPVPEARAEIEAPAPAAEVSHPTAPETPSSETAGESTESPTGDTAPRRASDSLIEQSRRSLPVAPEEGSSPALPRRGDETVPFSTAQARRARHDSRPEPEIEAPAAGARRPTGLNDGTETMPLTTVESAAIREAAGPELYPEGTAEAARDSEAPMEVREGEAELLDPVADSSEIDFSDVSPEPAPTPIQDGTPTMVPPAPPSRPVGPPPLPPARPAGPPPLPGSPTEGSPVRSRSELSAAIQRGSTSAEPFLLLRRRVREYQPESDVTSGVRVDGTESSTAGEHYRAFVRHADSFILQLYTAHHRAPDHQEFFDVEVSPNGEMALIDGALMFRHESDGYSYFSIQRRMPDPEMPHRVDFMLERLHLSEEHEAVGYTEFLRGLFPPVPGRTR